MIGHWSLVTGYLSFLIGHWSKNNKRQMTNNKGQMTHVTMALINQIVMELN